MGTLEHRALKNHDLFYIFLYFFRTLLGLALSWQVLHVLRFILGLSIGGALVTLATYVAELILPGQRMLLRGVFNWVGLQYGFLHQN